MSQFPAALALSRMTHPRMHVPRGRTSECVACGGLGRFLTMRAENTFIVGLAGNCGLSVGFEGGFGGGGAWRKGFGVEFGDGVVAYQFAWLMLCASYR